MHILLIHQAFAALNEPGGTRHYEFAKYLVEQGHTVTIITSPVSYLTGKMKGKSNPWVSKEQPEPGITILRTYTYPALHRSFVHRVLSFFSFMFSSFFNGLGVKNVSLVWGTTPPIFQGWTAWLLARFKGVPFLFEVRDLWPAFAIAVGVLKNKVLIWLSQWLESFLYKYADEIVVNSPGFIDHVTRRGGNNISLVENGVDLELFPLSQSGEVFRQKYALGNKFVVLYAGAHGLSNDLEIILTSARMTLDDPEIAYVFVGDGKEKHNLIQLAESGHLSNVHFVSSVPKTEMSGVLSAADVCVAILKPIEMYKTTYPNKVFDYLATGKPVLLLIDGVIRDVVEKAGAGVFIEPGDAAALATQIRILKNDPERTKEMGRNGRAHVDQFFNRKKLAQKLETIFFKDDKIMKSKILIVEDEKALRETLAYNLVNEGYDVETSADGLNALEVARKISFDLILLDIMLPGMDGFEVCRTLRTEMNTPILMLTARDDEIDRVVGLEVGADDYMVKPFSMRELIARVKAMLRRVRIMREEAIIPPPLEPLSKEILQFDDLTIDTIRREVRLKHEKVELKPKEYELLHYLAINQGRALSRDKILEEVWGWDYVGESRTVDVHIRWLRQKIETDPANPRRLVTVRGSGYRFEG